MNKNKAFTLIEVLIVTAIISLVASIVNAQMGEARKEANDKHKVEEARQVNNALGIHRTSNSSSPSNPSMGSYVAYNEKSSEYQSSLQKLVDSKSIPEIPRSPNGKDYFYLVDDSGNGVFGAILRSDSEINSNNGCYFSEPEYGCAGGNASYKVEYDRDTLLSEADSCDGSCDGVSKELEWTGHQGEMSWYDAEDHCAGLDGDYRLPTIEELGDALRAQFDDTYEDYGSGPGGFSEYTTYWSDNDYDADYDYAWFVGWGDGSLSTYSYVKSFPYQVRCVR